MLAYITINIDPVIGHLGFFTLRWYPLLMAIGTIAGAYIFAGQLRRKGIDPGHVVPMLFVCIRPRSSEPAFSRGREPRLLLPPPGDDGQTALRRLGHLRRAHRRDPGAGHLLSREEAPGAAGAGRLALAIPVGQIIGRCANIINGDTWGSPTHLPWGFVYRNPNALLPANLLGVPTHPTPVYEQLWLIIMLAILWYAVPRLKTDGMAILLYLGLYSFGRFFISFYRVNNILLLGLREAQLVALAVLVPVVPAAILLRRRAAVATAAAPKA